MKQEEFTAKQQNKNHTDITGETIYRYLKPNFESARVSMEINALPSLGSSRLLKGLTGVLVFLNLLGFFYPPSVSSFAVIPSNMTRLYLWTIGLCRVRFHFFFLNGLGVCSDCRFLRNFSPDGDSSLVTF